MGLIFQSLGGEIRASETNISPCPASFQCLFSQAYSV